MNIKRYLLISYCAGETAMIGNYNDHDEAYDTMLNEIRTARNLNSEDIEDILEDQKNEDFDEYDTDIAIFENHAWAECTWPENTLTVWNILDLEKIPTEKD